jgi:hypothetical protein
MAATTSAQMIGQKWPIPHQLHPEWIWPHSVELVRYEQPQSPRLYYSCFLEEEDRQLSDQTRAPDVNAHCPS